MSFTILVTAVLAVQTPAGDTGNAYLDAEARRLVAASRARRETIDRSITGYRTTMRERIGVGIRALRRDRLLYRRELALRIDWRRDSVAQIDVIGAREQVPAAAPKRTLPEDLKGDAGDYAFDPADDRLTIGFSSSSRDSTADSTRERRLEFQHPLAPGSEAHYRFATGDSSVVLFPNGRTIRLRELRIIPRRLDVRLMTGSFWIDEDSHAVVRALVRPARAFDLEQDLGEDDDDIPGFVKPIRVEFRFLTIDYGLWEGRWWMPRLIAMDAVATAGSILQMPVRYERVYDDYDVTGDTTQRLAPRPPVATAAEDSIARAACHAREDAEQISCKCRNGHCLAFRVNIPTDTAALLVSAILPPPFGAENDTLIASGELRELDRAIGKLPAAPWQLRARPPRWGLARFNRVEGLSLGARGELDLGRLRADGALRIATTDGARDVEAGIVREDVSRRVRFAGYYRLTAVDPTARSLGIGNSLNALFLGRDDGDYFRAAGLELTITPAVTLPQRFTVRVYAEQQRDARKLTDFSVPNVFNDNHLFRPNIVADSADQVGASLTLRTQLGIDPALPRWSADVTLDGGAGTYEFSRASATVRLTTPLAGQLAGALELAGGMSAGRLPVQSYWYLGGPGTLRGYGGNATSGDAFWRGRLELANSWPAARLVFFADVGRAGPREHLSLARSLAGVGVGASFLDGLVRLDVARAVRSPTGWRVDFYTDAAL
ncbi:MAG TPA: BamA/TamA family outer membrane protein [Gemmatimonadales bacterium]|nr:BamA/TamA family outer membrane protein [Gemmatimonadales bacterium]